MNIYPNYLIAITLYYYTSTYIINYNNYKNNIIYYYDVLCISIYMLWIRQINIYYLFELIKKILK